MLKCFSKGCYLHSCFRVGVYLYIVSNHRDKNMQTLDALPKLKKSKTWEIQTSAFFQNNGKYFEQ